ncbi:hypothetical protein PS2_000186 [Malus domestica]
MSIEYNGRTEHRLPPKVLSGAEILQQLDKVRSFSPRKYENNRERDQPRAAEELNWTKKSIFFELEYWSKLRLRHNIDVMHVEKNICDSVMGTLLNIKAKQKTQIMLVETWKL